MAPDVVTRRLVHLRPRCVVDHDEGLVREQRLGDGESQPLCEPSVGAVIEVDPHRPGNSTTGKQPECVAADELHPRFDSPGGQGLPNDLVAHVGMLVDELTEALDGREASVGVVEAGSDK